MLFTSFEFFLLLVITFALYYLPINFFRKGNTQLMVLILSSIVFYGYYDPALLFLLLFSGAVNLITSYLVSYGKPNRRFATATVGVVINLLVLAFFKYSPMFATSFFDTSKGIGHFLITIPLPIGISFFTFEGISLVIDTYKGHTDDKFKNLVDKNILTHVRNSFFFIVFFPHLVSGPILKAHDFIPQIGSKLFKDINWQYVFKTIVVGYFLKLVIADNLKDFTASMIYPGFTTLSSLTLVTMLLGYSFQIFADFAGYSLIALGLAGLFGYTLMQNFNFPYISTSFSEFWRRWHISLSTFLKEYLYFPLGGNQKGKVRTYINLAITMVLGGLWHGAAWSYAVWGAFHGGALAIERLFNDKIKWKITKGSFFYYFKILFIFLSVTLAWLLFKLPDFTQVIAYVKAIFTNTAMVTNYINIFLLLLYSLPVVLYHFIYLKREAKQSYLRKLDILLYGIMLFLIFTNSGTPGAFIYFQF
jgi:alginate O-acetyltransferase complex protein AlgI